MKRRQLLMGLTSAVAISGLSAGAVSAGIFDDAWTALKGHTNDLYDRATAEDAIAPGKPVKAGTIREDDPGQDRAHWAKGTTYVVEDSGTKYLQLGKDFETGLAPDLHVYVSANMSPIMDEAAFFATEQVELGRLTLGKGASYYVIPEGVDPQSVTIWCKAFSQFMGSASLQ